MANRYLCCSLSRPRALAQAQLQLPLQLQLQGQAQAHAGPSRCSSVLRAAPIHPAGRRGYATEVTSSTEASEGKGGSQDSEEDRKKTISSSQASSHSQIAEGESNTSGSEPRSSRITSPPSSSSPPPSTSRTHSLSSAFNSIPSSSWYRAAQSRFHNLTSNLPPMKQLAGSFPPLQRLTSTIASQRSTLEPRLRSELNRLGEKWNTYSGYDQIELAKARVVEAEDSLAALRSLQHEAKASYLAAVEQRSTSQKTINDLLSRKSSWSDADLIQYTSLLRSEHAESRAEEAARDAFDKAEREVVGAWDDVVKRTLERYHDEQVWSDRVRNVSSYTQVAVIGLNVLVFALAILLVEPYKRRKLAETFEARLLKGEQQGREALQAVLAQFGQTVSTLTTQIEDLKQGQGLLLTAAGVQNKVAEPAVAAEAPSVTDAEVVPDIPSDSTDAMTTMQDATVLTPSKAAGIPKRVPVTREELLALLESAKQGTRFLHSPETKQEEQRRREVALAAGIGALSGMLLLRAVSGSAR